MHTPGPWTHQHDETFSTLGDRRIVAANHISPGIVFGGLGAETLANANLIAAAPDMLAKLQEIFAGMVCSCRLQHFVDGPVPCPTCQIGAVIKSATGS